MPKLKSLMAGLAISTGLTGGLLALGATTTSASAGTTQATSGAPVLINGCGWRCGGWGGGWRRHRNNNRTNVFVHNNNQNFNIRRDRDTHKEFDIQKHFWNHHDDDDDDDD